jgi:hypothetical protein
VSFSKDASCLVLTVPIDRVEALPEKILGVFPYILLKDSERTSAQLRLDSVNIFF